MPDTRTHILYAIVEPSMNYLERCVVLVGNPVFKDSPMILEIRST